MRIAINLASRTYEDEGQFYRRWGTALLLSVLLTLALIIVSVQHYKNSQKEWASARAAEADLAKLRGDESQAQQILAQPRNRGTRDQSQFLNASIQRKSFSWTRLMEDLEKIMPAGVRVTAVAPTIDQHNHFTLRMQVEGESREGAVELLRNMEKSPHFSASKLVGESPNAGNSSSRTGQPEMSQGIKFDMVTSYVPAEALEGGS